MGKRASDRRGSTMLWSCIAFAVAVSGCGGKNYSNSGAQNQPITTAFLRVTNAISDSPILLAGLDGTTLTRVSYGQATALQQVPSGTYSLDVQYIDTNGNAVAVINQEALGLGVDDQDTVYLLGDLASLHTKLVENPAPSIAAGSAEVQVMQASARAGSIDLYLTAPGADLATAPKLTTVAFEEASPLSTVSSSGTYQLRVTAAGDNSMTVLYDSGTFTIDDRSRVTFVVVDYFGPGGNGFRVLDQDSQVARLFPAEALPASFRVANMVANQQPPSVDVYLTPASGPPVAFAGVAYGTITAPPQNAAAGPATYTVTVAGDASTVLATGAVTLTAGERRTLVATRSLSGVATRTSVDATRPISGQGQITVVNAAPSAASVDAYFLTGGATVDVSTPVIVAQPVLAFAAAVRAPDTYDVSFTSTAVKTVIATGSLVVADPGIADPGIYSVYLIDAPGGGAPYQIVFGSN